MEFKVIKNIMTFPEGRGPYVKEINYGQWNESYAPKYDIRGWNEDHSKSGKGITLTEAEFKDMVDHLVAMRERGEI